MIHVGVLTPHGLPAPEVEFAAMAPGRLVTHVVRIAGATDADGNGGPVSAAALATLTTAPSLDRAAEQVVIDPVAPRYGYDLMKAARLPSGTLYPLLARLEDQKMVASGWETPQQDGQRPRKYYLLTAEGIRTARLELAQASARRQRAPARPGHPAPGSLG